MNRVLSIDRQMPWQLISWVTGVFAMLLAIAMLASHLHGKSGDPIGSPRLKALKQKLQSNPRDEALKQEIRSFDLFLRERYFTRLSRTNTGIAMLLGAVGLFLLASKRTRVGAKRLPVLKAGAAGLPQTEPAAPARWSVAATGGAFGVLLFVLSVGFTTSLPSSPAEVDKLFAAAEGTAPAAATGPDAASPEEMARNWPRFLGVNGGIAIPTNTPTEWDPASGKNVAWKIPAPSAGFNSPLIWGDRIFFSGGPPEKLEVICVELATGKVGWRQTVADVAGTPKQGLDIPESTGFTAPTMATDGRRVYVIFANGNVAAYTLAGQHVWTRAFGRLDNPYGHAISLATHQDRVIVQLDQGDQADGKSKLYSLDGRTGKTVWETPRKVGASWTTPVVYEAAGKHQVAALAVPWVIAYDAKDGAELWRVDCLNGEVTPSPIFSGGLLYITSPSEKVVTIKPDGKGDVSKTHVVWENEDNIPDVTTPACNGELLFQVTTPGTLTCIDVKDGKKVWEHEMDMEFHASPIISGKRVYLFSQKGFGIIIEAAREYKELFRVDMGDSFHATPAFSPDGRIVVRGMTHLWCLGNAAPPPK